MFWNWGGEEGGRGVFLSEGNSYKYNVEFFFRGNFLYLSKVNYEGMEILVREYLLDCDKCWGLVIVGIIFNEGN